MRLMIAAALTFVSFAPSALARQWEEAVTGWHFDSKDIRVELKDGVVNVENTVVFQILQDGSGKKPAANAEPTAQLYLQCESRQYRLWDVQTSSQMGPISNAMFDVAQALEHYCDRIGKMPDEKRLPRGQR